MDLQYSDRDVGYLLGVWFVALGFLTLSTTRPDYSPFVGPVGDPTIFGSLSGLILIGMVVARYRDVALGAPVAVCGGLVVWSVLQTLATGPSLVGARTVSVAGGLVLIGGLCVREGLLIARGRRHHGRHPDSGDGSHPRMWWRWWIGALVLLGVGTSGLL